MNKLEIIEYAQIEGLHTFLNTLDYRTAHVHPEWELILVLDQPLAVTHGQNCLISEPGQASTASASAICRSTLCSPPCPTTFSRPQKRPASTSAPPG